MSYIVSEEEQKFLDQYDIRRFDQPSVTADIAVFAVREDEEDREYRKDPSLVLSILLIKRGSYPYKDCWALPGGFLHPGESTEETALRELKEETSISDAYLRPFGIFSDVDRDPRGWIISHGFLALVDPADYQVHAGSDAWDARWFSLKVEVRDRKRDVRGDRARISCVYDLSFRNHGSGCELYASVEEIREFESHHEHITYNILQSDGFAFDHAGIILQAFLDLRRQTGQEGRIVFDLMPEKFTLNQLQSVTEIILDRKLLTPNFRRKIQPLVTETEETVTGPGHRPAKLFKRNLEEYYKA